MFSPLQLKAMSFQSFDWPFMPHKRLINILLIPFIFVAPQIIQLVTTLGVHYGSLLIALYTRISVASIPT